MINQEMTSLVHGFAVIENCCTQAECDATTTNLAATGGAGTRCVLDNVWCQSLASVLTGGLAETIPGIAELVAVQCTYFDKSAMTNWFVAYHQDRSIPVASTVSANDWPGWSVKEGITFIYGSDELLAQMIAVRLHLDDSTSENGPLRVIPDSHVSGTLSPERIDAIRESSHEQLNVSRGGVVVMRPLLLHASSKSRTISHRRVLHFLFGPTTLPPGLQWRCAV